MSTASIFLQIHREILEGTLQLPALPDIALRIRDALANPNIDLPGVARIIQADAGLTAYLIQIANSPLYRGGRPIDNLQTALSRLGLTATRNFATSYALAALYRAEQGGLKPLLKQLWQHSTRLAAMSSVLARHCKGFDADRALLAGLLQDIGVLPLIQKASKTPALLQDKAALSELLQKYAANIGCSLLKKWGFDDDMIEVVRSREDWMRDARPQADYADIVLIARLHTYAGTEKMKQLPRLTEMPALRKLPVAEVSPDFSLKLLDEARAQVQEVAQSLNG